VKTFNCIYEDVDLKLFTSQFKHYTYSELFIQVFSGVCDAHYLDNLRLELLKYFPNAKILGTTTDGEIFEGDVTTHKTVLSFTLFEKTMLQTYVLPLLECSYNTGFSLVKKIQKEESLESVKLLLSFSDGLNINGEEYVKGIRDSAPDLVLAGGMAGDNAAFDTTYVLNEKGVYSYSVVCATFSNPDLHIYTHFHFDWERIGKEFTITKSKENRVYTIDDMPAAKFYGKYLGAEVEKALPDMGIEFPLMIEKKIDGVSKTFARAVLQKHSDDSLSFTGDLVEGKKVQFGYGNAESILHNSMQSLTALEKRTNGRVIESVFVYSNMARRHLLGSSVEKELKPLKQLSSVSGFFTYGEFYHCKVGNELLNESMTVLALSESDAQSKRFFTHSQTQTQSSSKTLQVLSHLIRTSNDDLVQLNENLSKAIDKQTSVLKKNNTRYLEVLETLDRNIILSRADLAGIITHVSRAFCDISGYSREELIGKPHNIVRHPDMPSGIFKEMWQALKNSACWHGEVKNLRKDGLYYWIEVHAEPEYDSDGNKIGYFAIRHDITAHKKVEELSKEIEETQKEVVFRMGAIGESRSRETGNHVKRVAEYSYLLAIKYGISEKDALMLKQASPMHDIGKVAIADAILNKPGRLSDEEREIMNTHAEKGYEMLKHSNRPLLKTAATVAYEHHEHYNGKGYPRGLRGEEIHIFGRITALADVFDALGSARCYKKAWEDEKIFSLIKEQRAQQFDPKLVDIFFENLDTIKSIRARFKDEI